VTLVSARIVHRVVCISLVYGASLVFGGEARVGMIVPKSETVDSATSQNLPLIRLSLLGNWVKPREADLREDATIWDAALAAGGPIQWPPGMVQVMRKDTLLLQVNLAHAMVRKTTIGSLGLQSGDVMFNGFPAPPPPPPPPPVPTSKSAIVKEGLNISIQVLAIMSSMLFTYSTYIALHAQGKL